MKAASLNHVYRLVWSKVHSAWVAVAEIATSQGKSSSAVKADALTKDAVQDATLKVDFKTSAKLALVVTCALQMFNQQAYALDANALPTGAQSVYGNSTISVNGNVMNINQTTQNAVVNWQTFNIGSGAAVNLYQPNAGSALYRVLGNDASQIYGQLNATGQLFLINPNGVLFGQGAQVNVGGLVASTLNISNADFLNGRYVFNGGNSTASVSNYGTIQAGNEGFVVFLGNTVNNTGTITATNGSVSLAAGQEAVLDFYGNGLVKTKLSGDALNAVINNSGNISATGGAVQLATNARASAINVSGIIEANSLVERNGVIRLEGGDNARVSVSGTLSAQGLAAGTQGGNISVTGEQVALFAGANLDASGQAGGGTVLVGGDLQGKNADVYNARTTYVDKNASINVDATQQGNGGKAIVWANDIARFYGNISAKGGAVAGNGGFVEVSGKLNLDFLGTVDLSAINGVGGQFLLDPWNIILQSAAGTTVPTDNASGVGFADIAFDGSTSATPDTTIQISKITGFSEAFFQANNNITVSAGVNMVADKTIRLEAKNDINIDAAVVTNGTGNIKLSANNNINLKAGLTSNGTGNIDLKADADSSGTGNLAIGANITSRSGGIDIKAATITRTAGNIAATGLADANAGNINITTTGAANLGAANITAIGGAAGTSNAGKNGGVVTIVADGGYTGTNPINVSGSAAGATSTGQSGGNAGSVSITSKNGISTGNITASGGAGSTTDGTGGSAGNITLNNSVAGDITTEAITSRTGVASGTGAGGNAATVSVTNNFATGAVTVGAISVAGNEKANGGSINVSSAKGITLKGNLTSTGGADSAVGASGGNITLTGDVLIDADTIVTASGGTGATTGTGGTVNFNGKIDGAAKSLTINTNGAATLAGAIGSVSALQSLTTNVLGSTTLSGGSVKTIGAQTYNDSVTLGNTTTFTTTNANITFADKVDAASNKVNVDIGTGEFTAGNANNDFATVAFTTAGKATIQDANAINLGTSKLTGALNITAKGLNGGVTQTASEVIEVGGDTTIDVGNLNNVTLNGASNKFNTITINAAKDVNIKDADALALGNNIVTGNLTVNTTGDITQVAGRKITVGGDTSLNAGANKVTFSNANNDFNAVTLSSVSDVVLTDIDNIAFGASTIGGTLRVTSGGDITQSAALSVVGDTTFVAGTNDVLLDHVGNDFSKVITSSAKNLTLKDKNDLALGFTKVSQNINVTAVDNIEIAGTVASFGNIDLTADTFTQTSGNIVTTGAAGSNAGNVEITATGLADLGSALIVATGGTADVGGAGKNGGNVTIVADGGYKGTGNINASGSEADATAVSLAGGNAGIVSITSKNGISTAAITAAGGAGSSTDGAGGNAGNISINNSVAGDIVTTGALTSRTGAASGTGAGGTEAAILVRNTATTGKVTVGNLISSGNVNGKAGSITVFGLDTVTVTKDANIIAAGGSGVASGAEGGNILITAYGGFNASGTTIIASVGGSATEGKGGNSGTVTIKSEKGIEALDTVQIGTLGGSAGTTSGANNAGGNAGEVQILNAEIDELPSISNPTPPQYNDYKVTGNVKLANAGALSGDSTGTAFANSGSVSIKNENRSGVNALIDAVTGKATPRGDVIIDKEIKTAGGLNGNGGAVTIYSTGKVTTTDAASKITTSGGTANADSAGASGGAVNITAYDVITLNAEINTSGGGAGSTTGASLAGGNAGAVTIKGEKGITLTPTSTVGNIIANGGAAMAGSGNAAGGAGGTVKILNAEIDEAGVSFQLNDGVVDGNIQTAGISAKSGNAAGTNIGINGKSSTAGSVTVSNRNTTSRNVATLAGDVTIGGAIDTSGGQNSKGGNVDINTFGTVTTQTASGAGTITTNGGAGNSSTASSGGAAGNVDITAYNGIEVNAAINANGGSATLNGLGGDAGAITVMSEKDITFNTTGTIDANGGSGHGTYNNSIDPTRESEGGKGGTVLVQVHALPAVTLGTGLDAKTTDIVNVNDKGAIKTAAITARSGNGAAKARSAAGSVTINGWALSNNTTSAYDKTVTIGGLINTQGGANSVGGNVTISAHGLVTTTTSLGSINTQGGVSNADLAEVDGVAGANGGTVTITTARNIILDDSTSINTSGANSTLGIGGNAGAVWLKAETGIAMNGSASIVAKGGNAAIPTKNDNQTASFDGGSGGAVTLDNNNWESGHNDSVTGDITVGAITTSSGNAVNQGTGQSGAVTVFNQNLASGNVAPAAPQGDVTIAKAITTTGGKNGKGGAVTIYSTGKVDTLAGGTITTSGGTSNDDSAGANGGEVKITAYDAITVNAAITTSGSNANSTGTSLQGGNAGNVTIKGEKGITLTATKAAINANGGKAAGTILAGGQAAGGTVLIQNVELDGATGFQLNDGVVTGDINTDAINAKSGDSGFSGGSGVNSNSGSVTVSNKNSTALNTPTLAGDVNINGAINTSGGKNGVGGAVTIDSYGAVTTKADDGSITTNGGDSDVENSTGARAGNVSITAYKAVVVGAAINANGGNAGINAFGGNAGAVTVKSESGISFTTDKGTISANGGAGNGTLTLAGDGKGGGGTLVVSKGGQGGVITIANEELDGATGPQLNSGVVRGDITTTDISAKSGNSAGTATSTAGSVTVTNNNVGYLVKGDPLTKLLKGDVTIDGAIDTTGGKNSNGGAVTITTNGKAFTTTKGSITAQGGQANADSNGGAGGGVTITAYDDISLAGTINTSGEDASLGNGGSAGFVTIESENDITLATTAPITANGGAAATNGNGGANGAVTIRTAQLDGTGADNLNNSLVDGEIKVAAITANVGNGAGTGARGATGLVLISNNDNTTTSTAASANGAKDITLAAAISANGDGEAVRVVSANDVDAGAGSITTSNPAGFYRVYARTPVTFGKGGLTGSYDFVQYATSLGGGILGTGDGLIYKVQPTMTAKLEGTASKSFDGNATAPISGVTKVTGTGGLDGDVLELNNLIGATYDNANPGTAKVVTGSYNYATTAEGKPAYNYIFIGGDPIGEILTAPSGTAGFGSMLPPQQQPFNGANLVNVGSTAAGEGEGGSSCDTDSLVGSAGGGAVINNGGINTPEGVNVNCNN